MNVNIVYVMIRHKIYEMYLKSNADSETSAKEFIKVCEKYFNTN